MNGINNTQLPIIDNLYASKNKELKRIADNLQVNDIKDDKRFEAIVERAKQQVSLSPVTFGEPKVAGNRTTTIQAPPNYRNPMGGPQEVFVITVDFPITGSKELFGYNPNNVRVVSGRVYRPQGGKVSVEVTLSTLDKEKALSEARGMMEATKSIVEANSKQALDWSNSMESSIESLLQQRRKELLDLYS